VVRLLLAVLGLLVEPLDRDNLGNAVPSKQQWVRLERCSYRVTGVSHIPFRPTAVEVRIADEHPRKIDEKQPAVPERQLKKAPHLVTLPEVDVLVENLCFDFDGPAAGQAVSDEWQEAQKGERPKNPSTAAILRANHCAA